MLINVRLYRRHSDGCNSQHQPHLKEDVLDKCNCNLGHKGSDPKTRAFRRLMFKPAIKGEREAWRALENIEQGKPLVIPRVEKQQSERLMIRDAFEKYLAFVRERNVRESSIYSMFRPVGNTIGRYIDSKGLKYMDELGADFGPEIMSSVCHLTMNVRANYRRYLMDFCRIAKANEWTTIDLAARIEVPARGKGRTAPLNPTEAFDLDSELPKIIEAISHLEWTQSKHAQRSMWKLYPETAKAFLWLLLSTGLRIGDAMLFEPRSLERRTVEDRHGVKRDVYVRLVRKQKKTDAPVFVIIPFETGELIRRAPRFSDEYAFCLPGRSSGPKLQSWQVAASATLFPALETASGVQHIHAHRFRDTFAVKLLDEGADIRFVSRALGHASVVVTYNHYSHFLRRDQDSAVKTMLDGWDKHLSESRVLPTLQTANQTFHG